MSVEFERKSRKKRRWGRVIEYSSYEKKYIFSNVYDDLKKKIEKQIAKSSCVTPQELAAGNDIRVSVAKQVLTDLEGEGKIKQVFKAHRIRAYAGTKS